MQKKRTVTSSFNTFRPGAGIHAIFALAAGMTPESVMNGLMRKRGLKKKKDEGDVERLAKAVEKRERRAARNLRNAERMAEGESLRGIK